MGYCNKFGIVNLDTYEYTQINSHLIIPQPRSLHSTVLINEKIYLFGGIDSSTIYNDLWTFNILTSEWRFISASGEIPSPRYLHAADSDGDAFIIWGGQDASGLIDSLFIYNSITGFWTELKPSSPKPRPAKGSCMVMNNFDIFIYGGSRNTENSNELWSYDIGNNKYELLDSNGIIASAYSHCWVENDLFYVSLGSSDIEEPFTKIVYFNWTSSLWKVFHYHKLSQYDSAQSNQIFIDNALISIGGQMWMVAVSDKISVLRSGNQFEILDVSLNFWTYGSSSVYFNQSLFIFGGGSVLGQSLLPDVGHNLLAKISIDEICKDVGCEALCSSGTRFNGIVCEVCPPGTHSMGFGNVNCTECLPGTYSEKNASNSVQQCLPCREGEFSNVSAASECFPCPKGKHCPIGSISPSEKSVDQISSSIQPSLYKQPNLQKFVLLYRILVSIPIFLIFLIFVCFKRLRARVNVFDLFSDKHANNENHYMIKKKTNIGACFSFLFVIGTLLLSCTTVLNYFSSNIQETKSQVPLVVLESEVSSFKSENLQIKFSLISYGGQCESRSKCLDSIKISLSNIICSKTIESCKLSKETCSIIITCENGEIETGGSISLILKESRSYASAIYVNLTADSSIPDEISSITSSVVSQDGSVFRGSLASEFYFLATPSLFRSESSKWDNDITGYHISEKNSPNKGSQILPEDLPAVSNLNIKVFIDKSSTGLLTVRLLKQDFVIFIGALLGSASGILAIAGFSMSIFEQQVEKFRERNKTDDLNTKRREAYIVTKFSNTLESSKIDKFG